MYGVSFRLGSAAVLAFLVVAAPASATRFEDDVLAQLNRARTDPEAFVVTLKDFRRQFWRDGSYSIARDGTRRLTREGTAAVDEAIAFVGRQPPLAKLERSPTLALAAADHSAEQGPQGDIGHASRDGTGPGERVRARGGDHYIAETISYGQGDPLDVVIQLIVDDGVANRGHRAVIFDGQLRYAGAGCGPHAGYGFMCTIDFGRTEKGTWQ